MMSYHLSALRIFTDTPILAEANGFPAFPVWYWGAVHRMTRVLRILSYPDGSTAQHGDVFEKQNLISQIARWDSFFKAQACIRRKSWAMPMCFDYVLFCTIKAYMKPCETNGNPCNTWCFPEKCTPGSTTSLFSDFFKECWRVGLVCVRGYLGEILAGF